MVGGGVRLPAECGNASGNASGIVCEREGVSAAGYGGRGGTLCIMSPPVRPILLYQLYYNYTII